MAADAARGTAPERAMPAIVVTTARAVADTDAVSQRPVAIASALTVRGKGTEGAGTRRMPVAVAVRARVRPGAVTARVPGDSAAAGAPGPIGAAMARGRPVIAGAETADPRNPRDGVRTGVR